MDQYQRREVFISSDEYSDDDDEASKPQDHNFRSDCPNNLPKLGPVQKQKELSSLIRRNKISVIYKNKAIRWLNNKRKRQRYKKIIYLNENASNIGRITTTAVVSEQEQCQEANNKLSDQKYNTVYIEEAHKDEILMNNKENIQKTKVLQKVSSICTLNYNSPVINIQSEKYGKIATEKNFFEENKNIALLEKETSIGKGEEILGKTAMSKTSPILNEKIEMDNKYNDNYSSVPPQVCRNINEMFPKNEKVTASNTETSTSTLLTTVEDKIKNLANEIDALNEILHAKEMEWNRLSHLKMVKEEIYSRLIRKREILQLKKSLSNKQDQNILLELKELEFYLAENKTTTDNKPSSVTIQELIENRANMNAHDLKREQNNTSRLHSLLVSQNMLYSAESLEKTCGYSNGAKNFGMYNQTETLINNKGRQGDVGNIITDFRQSNSELLPRIGKRFKSGGPNTHDQGYGTLLIEKTSDDQVFNKAYGSEFFSLQNSLNGMPSNPIIAPKKSSSNHDIDFAAAVNQHSVSLKDTFLKNQVKADINGKCPRKQYPQCQECKIEESRFVCAGCGNQWYCSRKCQVSAWDTHSELCTE